MIKTIKKVQKVGINGLGRIGKCVFLQLLSKSDISICALNATNIKIDELEDYLMNDSTHKRCIDISVKFTIISDNQIQIGRHTVTLLSNREARNLNWSSYGCEYIIDATGSYLTSKKCEEHGVNYVIMSAPAKDITKTFIYGVNHLDYNGDKVVSVSSCTTNSIAPMLKLLNDNYKIIRCNFTTIHATTASQYVVDILNKNSRISRSVFNNIIPHTSGASSSITSVLPELDGKIHGTSLRVPVSNGSIIDVNVELEDKTTTIADISSRIKENELFNIVYQLNNKNLVSSDFITTVQPTILDVKASIDMGDGRLKLMIWYDNEWSYSAQLIRMLEYMHLQNSLAKIENKPQTKEETPINSTELLSSSTELLVQSSSFNTKYFKNIEMKGLRVVLRVDYNVPMKDGVILDDFRITSTIGTIKYILEVKKPKYLLLTAHFGRSASESLKFIVPILENLLKECVSHVRFLPDGISEQTMITLNAGASKVYLLENLRIHKEETLYEYMTEKEIENNKIVRLYRSFGDVFISDAFGCTHRPHMSICDPANSRNPYGYGELIRSELCALDMLIANESKNRKVLGIIGGNKIKDKMPLIDSISKINCSTIFVAGGIASKYVQTNDCDNVVVMMDGYGDNSTDERVQYIEDINDISSSVLSVYDIGEKSIKHLFKLVDEADVIFWNGSLGKIEDDRYIKGSKQLAEYLVNATSKSVIIGGGETASLFNKKHEHEHEHPHIYISTGGGALLDYLQNKILYNKGLVGISL